jgi:hypothetical protein
MIELLTESGLGGMATSNFDIPENSNRALKAGALADMRRLATGRNPKDEENSKVGSPSATKSSRASPPIPETPRNFSPTAKRLEKNPCRLPNLPHCLSLCPRFSTSMKPSLAIKRSHISGE